MADRYRIQNSYDTEENWNNLNPVMRQGEIFLAEKANGKVIMKVGTSDKGMTANDCPTVWDEDVYLDSKAKLEQAQNSVNEAKQLAQDTLTETNEIIDRANTTMTEQVTSATNQANAAKQSADEAREIAAGVGKVVYTINNTPRLRR